MKGKKLDVWEGGIHVPAIIHWPTKIQPKVVNQQVHIVDWYPTLASIVGKANVNVDFDGVDLSPLLFTEDTMEERELYWVWHKKPNRWALRLGDWKLVHYGKSAPNEDSQWELFNIAQDKMEQVDLAKTKPKILKKLHHIYLEQRKKDKHL
jgi:arylsulfatase A-like enzyme